ncbi:MAG: NAD-dependent malic enzyme [Leptospirales bacterium]|jgi:malate dehydrogenase (oxaloacetate-decarboxylating)(NADP+)
MQSGTKILYDAAQNKSIAFTREERAELGLRGLLPYASCGQELQIQRVMANIRRKAYDIERYVMLSSLQDRNERLFYQTVIEHIEEIMPLIYTPTVGQACREFSHIFRRAKGFYITPDDRGDVRKILDNWPEEDVRVVVVTDGQRVLGLGDLGANGMGIPIGKLALYTACAGIHPQQCLPVMLDVGTNNQELLDEILYLGYPHKRIEGAAYRDLVEEFVAAIQDKYPKALIQFEDFLTPNAYSLLREYRDRVLCFNDDIQGTAAVSLAGVYAASRITGTDFEDLRIMFLGAGSAATGIADLMVAAFQAAGLSESEARRRLWFVDVNGLVVAGRGDLMPHNSPYSHEHEALDFVAAIDAIRPHVLIGATGAPGTFTEEAIRRMGAINERPVIFALSNPTSRAECTAEDAYRWSDGKAVFASGSPFSAVEYQGRTLRPGQGNNAYIFPGIGLGAVACEAKTIPEELFLTAARCLADQVKDADIAAGTLYPSLREIRTVSLEIAVAVARQAYAMGIARGPEPDDLRRFVADSMYDPRY